MARSKLLDRYEQWGYPQDTGVILPKVIRVNTLVCSHDELIKRIEKQGATCTKIPFLRDGYTVEAPFSLASTPEYLLGYYYIQEAASQVAVDVVSWDSCTHIIDMCAAPGGKTTQLASRFPHANIIACDNNSKRIQSLTNNIQRMGSSNTLVLSCDARSIAQLSITPQAILLDAPCSGNYATDVQWFSKRTLSDIKAKSQNQKELLSVALNKIDKDGQVLYCTCSLEQEENEQVVQWALDTHDVTLKTISLSAGSAGLTQRTHKCRRFWPQQHGTQGFFLALFEKNYS